MKSVLTENNIRYINRNYLKYSAGEISEKIGVNKGTIRSYLRRNRMDIPKEIAQRNRSKARKGLTNFTKAEDKFIRKNYLVLPIKKMASILERSGTGIIGRMKNLGLEVPKELIEKRKKESCFQKGQIPMNKGKKRHEFLTSEQIEAVKKTQFKKGNISANTAKAGEERIIKGGYTQVKMDKRMVDGRYNDLWKMKHVIIWEDKNGPLPEGMIVTFRNKDITDFDPDNLVAITREEHMINNSVHKYPEELKPLVVLKNKLNKTIKEHEQKK